MPYSQFHKLEHSVYIATRKIIKEYPKLINEYDSIIGASPIHDGQPRGKGISDPTGRTALRLMEVSIKIDSIHKGLDKLPECYRNGVFAHIVYGKPYPEYLCEYSWRTWQYRFVYFVREKLNEKGM